MAIGDELSAYVKTTFASQWSTQDANVVPAVDAVPLNNTAKLFKLATFLYADLSGSTKMVEALPWTKAAEIYKAYLYCAARLIRYSDGEVVAYDGDRVMGVFLGDTQSTNAVKCALRINWARQHLVQPAYDAQYGAGFEIGHTVGVDASEARCCRTGIRGDNDLVWVGSAPNVAAKLTSLSGLDRATWITNTIFDRVMSEVKVHSDGRQMWEARSWTQMNDRRIYASNWHWFG